MLKPIERGERLLDWLRRHKLALDQKLERSLELVGSSSLEDVHILEGLIELNTKAVGKFGLQLPEDDRGLPWWPYKRQLANVPDRNPEMFRTEAAAREIFAEAANLSLQRNSTFVTTGDYLKATASHFDTGRTAYGYPVVALELIARCLPAKGWRPKDVFNELVESLGDGEEYVPLALILDPSSSRTLVRPLSWLGDYAVRTREPESASRALLSHYRDAFGLVFEEEIQELEGLINTPAVTEAALQEFFAKNPHFFGHWEFREIFPQVFIQPEGGDSLVPDFILTDPELHRAVVVELKKPMVRLVRNQKNRERFSAAVYEAAAQLRRYKDAFNERAVRDTLRRVLGMEVMEPRLAVVIGRSADFVGVDRARLEASLAGIDVCTYDDLLIRAKRRRASIAPSVLSSRRRDPMA